MAFVTLEDSFGEIELVLFPSTWAKTSHMVEVGSLLVVEGKMQHQERGGDSVIANSVSRIQVDDAISEALQLNKARILKNPGKLPARYARPGTLQIPAQWQ